MENILSFSNNKIENKSNAGINRYSVFVLANKIFGLELSLVKEVISVPKITKLPNVPAYMIGVFNLRGTIITLMDISKLLGSEKIDITPENMIVVIEHNKKWIGIFVEKVLDLITIDDSDIQLPKREMSPKLVEFITGSYEKEGVGLIHLLNINKLLSPHVFYLTDNF